MDEERVCSMCGCVLDENETIEVDGDAIPNLIYRYWYNPVLDPSEFRHTVYHGMITNLNEVKIRGEEAIISVAVFAGGKPTVYKHFINEPDFWELDDLA